MPHVAVECHKWHSMRSSRRRGYVTPEDVEAVSRDVLRHRLVSSYEAEAESVTS